MKYRSLFLLILMTIPLMDIKAEENIPIYSRIRNPDASDALSFDTLNAAEDLFLQHERATGESLRLIILPDTYSFASIESQIDQWREESELLENNWIVLAISSNGKRSEVYRDLRINPNYHLGQFKSGWLRPMKKDGVISKEIFIASIFDILRGINSPIVDNIEASNEWAGKNDISATALSDTSPELSILLKLGIAAVLGFSLVVLFASIITTIGSIIRITHLDTREVSQFEQILSLLVGSKKPEGYRVSNGNWG